MASKSISPSAQGGPGVRALCLLAVLPTALLLMGAAPTDRVTYCCEDDKGHKTCGDVLPPQCYNKAYRIISKGNITKTVDAPLSAEQKAQRDAQDKQRKLEEQADKDKVRRDRALMDTYANEQEIDAAMKRAVERVEVLIKDIQVRQNKLQERRKTLNAEAAFYTRSPMPAELRQSIKDNENELKISDEQIKTKRKEAEAVRARFEEDRQRFKELSRR